MKQLLLAVGLTCLVGHSVSAREIHHEAVWEPKSVELGQPFVVRFVATHEPATVVKWPEPLLVDPGIEEVARSIVSMSQGDESITTAEVTLAVYDPFVSQIPPVFVEARLADGQRRSEPSQPLAIAVNRLVDPKARPMLRPLAYPRGTEVRDWRLIVLLCLGGLAAVSLLSIWFLFRRAAPRSSGSGMGLGSVEPVTLALARLTAIEASGELDQSDLRGVFREMSRVLRDYFEQELKLARELTTAELLGRLEDLGGSGAWSEDARGWFRDADLVKFARSRPQADEARAALYAARQIVERVHAGTIKIDQEARA